MSGAGNGTYAFVSEADAVVLGLRFSPVPCLFVSLKSDLVADGTAADRAAANS